MWCMHWSSTWVHWIVNLSMFAIWLSKIHVHTSQISNSKRTCPKSVFRAASNICVDLLNLLRWHLCLILSETLGLCFLIAVSLVWLNRACQCGELVAGNVICFSHDVYSYLYLYPYLYLYLYLYLCLYLYLYLYLYLSDSVVKATFSVCSFNRRG